MSKPRPLPSHPKGWSKEAKRQNVEGKRLNDVKVASGSKIGYEQFLLLRVLWKTYHPDQRKLPNTLKQYVSRAEELPGNSLSWNTYCSSFSASGIPEGTFAIPRLYQMLSANIEGTMRPNAFDTPIVARRTRSQKDPITSGVSKLQLRPPKTPEKQIMRSFLTPSPAVSLEEDDSTIEESPSPSPPPITPAAEVPEELQKYMFPPTADEQIVNTALVVFLNALTMHFNLPFLTMHQHGPWNTLNSRNMANLGPILLAITLYIDDQIKGDQMRKPK